MTTDEVSSPRPGWISQRLAPKTATGGHSRTLDGYTLCKGAGQQVRTERYGCKYP